MTNKFSKYKCEKCGSTLFHIVTVDDKKIAVCYRSKKCGNEIGLVIQ